MNFTSNTQEELQLLNIIDGNEYLIEPLANSIPTK